MKPRVWTALAVTVTLLLATMPVAAAGPAHPGTITGAVAGPVARGQAKLVGPVDPQQKLRLAILLYPPHMSEEQQFVHDVQTRGTPVFHRFLSPSDWNARFAPSAQDEQTVVLWAESQGLTVTARYPNRLAVDVEGKVADIERALGVAINKYQSGGIDFFSSDRDPTMPPSLTTIVGTMLGLNDYIRPHFRHGTAPEGPLYRPGPVKGTPSTIQKNGDPALRRGGSSGTSSGLDLPNVTDPNGNPLIDVGTVLGSQMYDVLPVYRLGHCCNPNHVSGGSPPETSIAISAPGGVVASSDLLAFANHYDLALNVDQIPIDGGSDGKFIDGDAEFTMDTEWSSATSNSFGASSDTAHVYLYESPGDIASSYDAIQQMITDDKARSFSASWGAWEGNWTATDSTGHSLFDYFDALFSQMVGQGWSLSVSSGDRGAYGNQSDCTQPAVIYPASDPNVVAAGGTTLTLTSGNVFGSEVTWTGTGCTDNANTGGDGGGKSSYWPAPSYQNPASSSTPRVLPDVSLNADAHTAQALYFEGQWLDGGGTSIVAPELAGLFANINAYLLSLGSICGSSGTAPCAPMGNPDYPIYYEGLNPTFMPHYPFYDITSGCNGGTVGLPSYCAGTGFDLATGWGSFNALQLAWSIIGYFVYDSHGPTVTFTGPTTNHWYSTDQTVNWTVADPLGSGDMVAIGVSGFTATWDKDVGDPSSHATPGCCDPFYDGPQTPNATSGSAHLTDPGTQGCHTLHVRAWDNQGIDSGDKTYGPICYDTVPPSTSSTLSGTQSNGSYTTPVTVTLTATDNTGGSGVASTVYQIDGGSTTTYSTQFTVSAAGSHTVTYHSTDEAGNVESSKTTTFTIASPASGTSISTGWNLLDVPLQGNGINSASLLISSLNATSQLGAGAANVAATYASGRFNLYVPGYSSDMQLQPANGIFVYSRTSGTWLPSGSPYTIGQQVALHRGWNLVAASFPTSGLDGSAIASEASGCGVQEIAMYSGGVYQTYIPTTGGAFHVPATSGMWIQCTQSYNWTPA